MLTYGYLKKLKCLGKSRYWLFFLFENLKYYFFNTSTNHDNGLFDIFFFSLKILNTSTNKVIGNLFFFLWKSLIPGQIKVLDLSEEVLMNVVQVLDGVDGQVKFHQLRHVNVIRKSKLKKIQFFFYLSQKLELYVVLTFYILHVTHLDDI